MRVHPAEGRSYPGAYRFARNIARPLLMRLTERHWSGEENLPPQGGYIAVSNHMTNFDPFTFAHFLIDHHVPVKMLAKRELFGIPLAGRIIGNAGMIPVERGTAKASDSLAAAKAALARGEVIGIFPEGTLSHDPDGWPMTGKTGAARLALETGVPLIPIAQWGAHRVMPAHTNRFMGFSPKRVDVVAGPAIDLSDFAGKPLTAQVLRDATDRIIHTLREMVGEIRGESPPEHVWNVSTDGNMKAQIKAAGSRAKKGDT